MAPLRKRGNYCCVVNCHNSNVNTKGLMPPVRFYRFPTKWYEKSRRQAWITAVRRTNADGSPWSPTETTRICSRHFVGNCKNDSNQHPSYVPTIFPAAYKKRTPDPEVAQRWKRRFERAARTNSAEQAVPQSTPQVDPAVQDQDTTACLGFDDTLLSDLESPEMPLAPISDDDPQPSAVPCERLGQAHPVTQADAACQTEPECRGNLIILLSTTNGSEASTQVSHTEQCDKVTGTDGSWKRKCEFFGFETLKQKETALRDIYAESPYRSLVFCSMFCHSPATEAQT
ncbi:peroxynitrite isomerase THAP4-like [Dermacentor silvarum]|uniref:peroxynitrite isomerase THAP4-like n=1 Tax=Dermacentor silvarum TaxID=543639 RepID=UPI002101C7F8|nr:peroxynitrite isomerase THAP4-like [Dermacentor silvarum]